MLRQWLTAALLLLPDAAFAQAIPLDEAAGAFATARKVSQQDAGRTWGMEVCGPMLFADASTNDVVANQPDGENQLKPAGAVWQGRLPASIHVANTALEWSGVRWTMVMWPLPEDTRARAQLLAHECYHRIQPALKLPAGDVVSSHLDGVPGRIWMFLEWRALERALTELGDARKKAIGDALRFREYRRSLIKNAARNENALEMNEGLADYTGVRLANPNAADRRAAAIFMLRDGPRRTSLVRSFAYVSGPAYGVLLDESGVEWRKTLTPASDLGAILAHAYQVPVSRTDEVSAVAAAGEYGGDAVMAAETARGQKREKELAEMRRRFIDGPVLIFPVLEDFSFGFNPNDLVPLDENSTVYRWLRVSDRWGVLEANGGMLVRENGVVKRVVVPAPKSTAGNALAGNDWKLDLKPGFKIVPGSRIGDLLLTRE